MVYEVQLKNAMAGIELYKAELNALQVLTVAYVAEVHVKGEKARMEIQKESEKVQAFQAEAAAKLTNAQPTNEYFRAVVALERAKIGMQAQIGKAERKKAFGNTLTSLGTSRVTIYANLAGAALYCINTLAAEILAS